MNNKEILKYLEWLSGDEYCAEKDKLPKWAKQNIVGTIKKLKRDVNSGEEQ